MISIIVRMEGLTVGLPLQLGKPKEMKCQRLQRSGKRARDKCRRSVSVHLMLCIANCDKVLAVGMLVSCNTKQWVRLDMSRVARVSDVSVCWSVVRR